MSKEMSHRDSEEEKLLGEIYEDLSRFAGHVVRYQADGDRHAEHECKMVFANSIITLIGKAYVEGVPLPGEVGRFETDGELGGKVVKRALNILARQGATRFIALRKEGTGKEEEK